MPLINHKNLGPLIINVDGLNLLSQERALIKHDLIGGIILFAHNFESKSQLKDLIADIKSIKDNILITIDHEGGRVQRLQDGFTNLPSFEKISDIKNHERAVSEAYKSGYTAACELYEAGIDVNYSPVVDIKHDSSNKLLNGRTFGQDVKTIIDLSDSYVKGCLDGSVLPVLKHFPGHGRVNTDSHIEDCVTDIDFETLRGADILPFKEIHSRFDKYNIPIMTSHLIYSNIDKFIITYSEKWLKSLSASIFSKPPIFISDDLEMYSATKYDNKIISCEDRVLHALKAGCRFVIATTMQNRDLIENKVSHKYFTENYITNNIIKYYEKNHAKMLDINLPKI